ncbi:MAG: GNAT family N-acetyltransferase [Candidatus Izemoplasmataceae bacterium]
MEIKIIKGSINYIDECVEALIHSELGRTYFSEVDKAKKTLKEGFKDHDIYLAVDHKNNALGFIWLIVNGIFHKHPYIHIVAVKSAYRGQGIGKMLLKHIEKLYLKDNVKLFLVVSDFNPNAKKMYQNLGYIEIGNLPNLYKQGITECLMMKSID